LDGVLSPVDTLHATTQADDFGREPLPVVEVAGHRPPPADGRAELDDVASRDEQVERLKDRVAIRAQVDGSVLAQNGISSSAVAWAGRIAFGCSSLRVNLSFR